MILLEGGWGWGWGILLRIILILRIPTLIINSINSIIIIITMHNSIIRIIEEVEEDRMKNDGPLLNIGIDIIGIGVEM